ncbi:DUF6082 family protein [Streptomyces sp. NPDC088360]|uniref:DUF6082 family protein n=1 Tax=Streptomyces sp. NPDC088360 TaxID=3154515 RepID=UPI003450BA38
MSDHQPFGEESSMTPRVPADAVIEQMMRDASPGQQAAKRHTLASLVAAIGLRRDPTGADIDELRRYLMGSPSDAREAWRVRGRRLGRSASRFLAGLSEGLAEARHKKSARGAVRHLGREWRAHEDDYVARLVAVHDMRLGLLREALGDPELAATLDVFESEVTPAQLRQFLFVEAVYRTYVLEWRVGSMTLHELYGNVRILLLNPIFRQYWEATRNHRASLDPDSAEAQIGRIADTLVQELDEADTHEWWVVGQAPDIDERENL